jgi:limonene-1,2-epoxide hydrolase
MKKTLLAVVSISVAAFAYANTASDSSELVSQQCKISAEAVSTLKGLRYGNTSIRKDVAGLININLKVQENKDAAQLTLNRMVDDQVNTTSALEAKYCS